MVGSVVSGVASKITGAVEFLGNVKVNGKPIGMIRTPWRCSARWKQYRWGKLMRYRREDADGDYTFGSGDDTAAD